MERDNEKVKIIIADDSKSFIEGLTLLLNTSGKYEIINICQNGEELVKCKNLYDAGILLIDIDMPILNGLEAAELIDREFPYIPKIAITMHEETLYLKDIISVGFKGFVSKPDTAITLFDTINQVLENNFVFPENLKL